MAMPGRDVRPVDAVLVCILLARDPLVCQFIGSEGRADRAISSGLGENSIPGP